MKLRDYIGLLNELVREHPESLDKEVVAAQDDEGNGFNRVHYAPAIGHFDGSYEFENHSADNPIPPSKRNAVCLN